MSTHQADDAHTSDRANLAAEQCLHGRTSAENVPQHVFQEGSLEGNLTPEGFKIPSAASGSRTTVTNVAQETIVTVTLTSTCHNEVQFSLSSSFSVKCNRIGSDGDLGSGIADPIRARGVLFLNCKTTGRSKVYSLLVSCCRSKAGSPLRSRETWEAVLPYHFISAHSLFIQTPESDPIQQYWP